MTDNSPKNDRHGAPPEQALQHLEKGLEKWEHPFPPLDRILIVASAIVEYPEKCSEVLDTVVSWLNPPPTTGDQQIAKTEEETTGLAPNPFLARAVLLKVKDIGCPAELEDSIRKRLDDITLDEISNETDTNTAQDYLEELKSHFRSNLTIFVEGELEDLKNGAWDYRASAVRGLTTLVSGLREREPDSIVLHQIFDEAFIPMLEILADKTPPNALKADHKNLQEQVHEFFQSFPANFYAVSGFDRLYRHSVAPIATKTTTNEDSVSTIDFDFNDVQKAGGEVLHRHFSPHIPNLEERIVESLFPADQDRLVGDRIFASGYAYLLSHGTKAGVVPLVEQALAYDDHEQHTELLDKALRSLHGSGVIKELQMKGGEDYHELAWVTGILESYIENELNDLDQTPQSDHRKELLSSDFMKFLENSRDWAHTMIDPDLEYRLTALISHVHQYKL